MSTISEETNLEAASQSSATNIAAAGRPATGAGATSASPETRMRLRMARTVARSNSNCSRWKTLRTLQKEGTISESEAAEKREQVARTRKLFRELSPAERAEIVQRRREIGRELMNRQLSGAAVVQAAVRLNHTRLKPG
jgi:hypothetical protein